MTKSFSHVLSVAVVPGLLTSLLMMVVTLGGCNRNDAGVGGSSTTSVVRREAPPPRPELTTALFAAIDADDEARAIALVEQGAPVNAMSDPRGITVLHRAAQMSMPNLARVLLEFGADLEIRIDGQHHQPIHWAARAGASHRPGRAPGAAEATIDVLLEYGADINSETAFGVRPIRYATESGNKEWEEFLVSRGAKP